MAIPGAATPWRYLGASLTNPTVVCKMIPDRGPGTKDDNTQLLEIRYEYTNNLTLELQVSRAIGCCMKTYRLRAHILVLLDLGGGSLFVCATSFVPGLRKSPTD